jgi:hypothetical protein
MTWPGGLVETFLTFLRQYYVLREVAPSTRLNQFGVDRGARWERRKAPSVIKPNYVALPAEMTAIATSKTPIPIQL